MAETTRVIGIDPGSRHMGYGVIDCCRGKIIHVDNGVISPNNKKSFSQRLAEIFESLQKVIDEFGPAEAAVEEVFYARNVKSAIKLGEARGVALLALANKGLDICEYPATSVKQSVTGFGRAEKCQVAAMTARLLGLPEPAAHDASDALAVAICHANNRVWDRKVAVAVSASGRSFKRR